MKPINQINFNVAKNLLLTLSSLLIICIFCEVVLRFFYEPLNSGWSWNDSPRRVLAKFENDLPNQIDVRGQQIKYENYDYIILLLGDSQVEAATCSPNKMPEILLEKYLTKLINRKIKVFSIATSGWGQDQQLLALQRYYKNFRADLVLIWATPKNDFWENAFPDRSVTRIAGHLKPTFRLNSGNLTGPYFESNKYFKNSALLQLVTSGIQKLKEETMEKLILKEWTSDLPSPHHISVKALNSKVKETIEIDLNKYSQNLFDYSDNIITVLTYEDFINSRSHFSPYAIKKSDRDNYLINITKKLFENINILAKSNRSEMFVFYPIREDFDIISKNCVKYVKNYQSPNHVVPVNLDYLAILKEVIPDNKLIYFKLDGENEICVNINDRHLNEIGNKQVIKNIAYFIQEKMKFQYFEINKKTLKKIPLSF